MIPRLWLYRIGAALLVAVLVNGFLSLVLEADHDVLMIALLAVAVAAVGAVALDALETSTHVGWTTPRTTAPRNPGEDVRTTMHRQLVEAHLSSRHAQNDVLWQIAALAKERLRQVHGFRYEDDPQRAAALLGPDLAEWCSHDRRHRYDPTHRSVRYSAEQLGEALRRIETL